MSWKGGYSYGGGATAGGNTQFKIVSTGALVANTPVSITHGINCCNNFAFYARNTINNVAVTQLYADPLNPTTNFIIEVGVTLPAGLIVDCFGSPTTAPVAINLLSGTVKGATINAAGGQLVIIGGFTPNINRALLVTWTDAKGNFVNLPGYLNAGTQTLKVIVGSPLPVANIYSFDIQYL